MEKTEHKVIKYIGLGALYVAIMGGLFYAAIKYSEFVAAGLATTLSQLPR